MKKFYGNFLFHLARIIEVVFGGLIHLLSILVFWVNQVRVYVISVLGCLVVLLFFNPFFLYFLLRFFLWIPVLFILIFPLLGTKFLHLLEYWRYILTQYLYDKSDYYRLGSKNAHNFKEYGSRYRRKQEEEARKRAEEEQRRQSEYWNQLFQQWFSQMGGFQSGASYSSQSHQQNHSGFYNPTQDFVEKYRRCCDVLEVPYHTDAYQVKLAYRKKAKEYHPDRNPSANAAEMFRRVTEAYEFLSEENILRYKNMQH